MTRILLSRTAESLYWLSRYVERADSTARLIEMGNRMAMLPGAYSQQEWRSVARASGCLDAFEDPDGITEAAIIRTLLLDKDNPSSIRACLENARQNAKAARTSLTMSMWSALNEGWRKLELMDVAEAQRDLAGVLDWVKARAAMIRGTSTSTMLRDDAYLFLGLGGHIERADMTLRLLDVKSYVLLPETEVVGGGRDHHQWTSVLHATSAVRAYHHVYRSDYSPGKIADFLILNPQFPRSVRYSFSKVRHCLKLLAVSHGKELACVGTAEEMLGEMQELKVGEIFRDGLTEFVHDAIGRTNQLGSEISTAFHFGGAR